MFKLFNCYNFKWFILKFLLRLGTWFCFVFLLLYLIFCYWWWWWWDYLKFVVFILLFGKRRCDAVVLVSDLISCLSGCRGNPLKTSCYLSKQAAVLRKTHLCKVMLTSAEIWKQTADAKEFTCGSLVQDYMTKAAHICNSVCVSNTVSIISAQKGWNMLMFAKCKTALDKILDQVVTQNVQILHQKLGK